MGGAGAARNALASGRSEVRWHRVAEAMASAKGGWCGNLSLCGSKTKLLNCAFQSVNGNSRFVRLIPCQIYKINCIVQNAGNLEDGFCTHIRAGRRQLIGSKRRSGRVITATGSNFTHPTNH